MKKSRRKARELAVRGLYQWFVSRNELTAIEAELRDSELYAAADEAYLSEILHGVADREEALEAFVAPHLDRPSAELSPIEHVILLLAAFELTQKPDVPYRVVINEAIELAKAYGGTDGHKYVNGVVDKLAESAIRSGPGRA